MRTFLPFFVYVLYSPEHDEHYVGQTKDLEKRFARHNRKNVASTKRFAPWNLIYSEEHQTRSEAVNRELFFKTKRGRLEIKAKIQTAIASG